jgi:hypothetical protein
MLREEEEREEETLESESGAAPEQAQSASNAKKPQSRCPLTIDNFHYKSLQRFYLSPFWNGGGRRSKPVLFGRVLTPKTSVILS